jgi:hypothetical protein
MRVPVSVRKRIAEAQRVRWAKDRRQETGDSEAQCALPGGLAFRFVFFGR